MVKDNQFRNLIEVLLNIEDKKLMEDFLLGILTPKELEEIPTRLQIVRLLKAGMSQHQIAKELEIGVATVTRGSKEIQKGRFKVVK